MRLPLEAAPKTRLQDESPEAAFLLTSTPHSVCGHLGLIAEC